MLLVHRSEPHQGTIPAEQLTVVSLDTGLADKILAVRAFA